MHKLPKGIRIAPYRNSDGITETHYRVRLTRANEKFKVDRRFHTIPQALAFLAECKTQEGRKRILAGIDAPTKAAQLEDLTARAQAAEAKNPGQHTKFIDNLLTDATDSLAGRNFTVNDAIASFSRRKLWPLLGKDQNGDPLAPDVPHPEVRSNHRDSAKKRERDLATIAAVKLPYMPDEMLTPEQQKLAGAWRQDLFKILGCKHLPLGEWPLKHLTADTAIEYVDARAGKYTKRNGIEGMRSVLTVLREISLLSSVLNSLKSLKKYDEMGGAWHSMGAKNPLTGALDKGTLETRIDEGPLDKRLAKPAEKKWDVLDEENERKLIKALEARRDRKTYWTPTCGEPLLIFQLSLATGLRLSEAVLLEWSYIDLKTNWIKLPPEATKQKETSRIAITPEARQIIESLPHHGAKRVFDISVSGLNSAMHAIYTDKANKGKAWHNPITGFSWHDLRRAAITDYLNRPDATPLKAALHFDFKKTKHVKKINEKITHNRDSSTLILTDEDKAAQFHKDKDQPLRYLQGTGRTRRQQASDNNAAPPISEQPKKPVKPRKNPPKDA